MPRWSYRFLAAAAALALSSCNCADPSTIGFTSCTSNDDCPVNGLRECCDGFCREKCEAKNDGGGGSGGGGGGAGAAGGGTGGGTAGGGAGGGTGTCVPACAAGQFCNAQNVCDCNATSCPGGCCSGATCTLRGISNCAPSGAQCAACDPEKADRCSTSGACQCGTVGADGGAATACGAGQRCVLNQCKCDATSCPNGCCSGNQCVTNTTAAACGLPGAACTACDMSKANACSATGACRCGTEPACGAGQACGANGCECNATSCTNGCCSGTTCATRSASTCGANGTVCTPCLAERADTCTAAGACSCGVAGLCGMGTRCVNGACVCDGQSCANGCCQGGVCQPLTTSACAPVGAACVGCPAGKADNCSPAGQCRCGNFPACGAAQTCSGGMCTGGACNSGNCATGCCDPSQVCQTQTPATCGSGGSACVACDPQRANTCATDGSCRCGANPACGAQQRCQAGACVCDSTTCPLGCCSGNQCVTPTAGACGVGGAICSNCGPGSDGCTNGVCRCGSSQACGAGQRCAGGACLCDGTSGCAGCCAGNSCQAPSATTCGSAGSTCVMCDQNLADGCANGSCTCGATAACSPGQKCSGGVCVCTPATCPSGCCSSGSCTAPPTLAKCGFGGATCLACDLNQADNCSLGGVCSCGAGAACAAGSRCSGGTCVCDGLSCGGCCSGTVCHAPPTAMFCGVNGAACVDCGGGKSCSNGNCIGTGVGGGGGTGGAGGSGGSGGSGAGGGVGGSGGSGTGGAGGVHHLQIRTPALSGDAGSCVQFSLEAADLTNQGMSSPINLSYVADVAPHITTYGNGMCSAAPTYFAGTQVQLGGLVSSKFGITNLYPTITNPTGYGQPSMPVGLTSTAPLTGFPSTLVYAACTPVTLVAGAPALADTQLSLSATGGFFNFTAGGSCAGVLPPTIFANSNQVTVRTRSYTGGTVNITGFPNVLQFTPVTVTLVRPSDGGVCAGQGQVCATDSDCCFIGPNNCSGMCLQ